MNKDFIKDIQWPIAHARCSTSLDIRDIEIKTPMRHCYSPIRMAKIRRPTIPSIGEDKGQRELPSTTVECELVIRETEIKTQCDTTMHLSQWLKRKRPTIPSTGENKEQIECSYTAGASVNWYHHLENGLTLSTKAKHMSPLWSSNSVPKKWGLIHQDTHMDAHRSFIHNIPKLKTTHMFPHSGIDKLCHIRPWNITRQRKRMVSG